MMRIGQVEITREYDSGGGYFTFHIHICKACFKRQNMNWPSTKIVKRDFCSAACAEVTA